MSTINQNDVASFINTLIQEIGQNNIEGKIPGGVERLVSLAARLDDKRRTAAADAKAAFGREMQMEQRAAERVNKLKDAGLNMAGDPMKQGRVAKIVEVLGKMESPLAQVAAAEVDEVNKVQLNAKTYRRIAKYEPEIKALGGEVNVAEATAAETSMNPNRYYEKQIADLRTGIESGKAVEQLNTKKQAAVASGMQKGRGKLGLFSSSGPDATEVARAAGVAIPETEAMQLKAMERAGEKAQIGANRKVAGKAALGAIVVGYLANKMFGKGGTAEGVDPQIQMALLQQMAARGGGGEDDGGRATGQQLMNMSRALNLIKVMSQMQAMQNQSPVDVTRML